MIGKYDPDSIVNFAPRHPFNRKDDEWGSGELQRAYTGNKSGKPDADALEFFFEHQEEFQKLGEIIDLDLTFKKSRFEKEMLEINPFIKDYYQQAIDSGCVVVRERVIDALCQFHPAVVNHIHETHKPERKSQDPYQSNTFVALIIFFVVIASISMIVMRMYE